MTKERLSELTKRFRSLNLQDNFLNIHTIIIQLVALLLLISDVVQLFVFKVHEIMRHFSLLSHFS